MKDGGNIKMKRKVLAFALSMSLLWCSTANAVYAAGVEGAEDTIGEDVVLETVEADATELEPVENPDTEIVEETVVEEVNEDNVLLAAEGDEAGELLSGECGENLTWTLTDDGVLTISGTGEMSFEDDRVPWRDYREEVEKAVIEDGVTSIADGAFDTCWRMSEVILPEGLLTIGEYAFYDCQGLTNIELPEGVITIGKSAFAWSSLDSITIPDTVTSLGKEAFEECSNLKEVILPKGITTIENGTFLWCINLEKVTIQEGVTKIGKYAFDNCESLETIDIPDSVIEIEDYAFNGCKKLKNIEFPEGLTKIGEWAFYSCESLDEVVIPNSVTTIEYAVFWGCESLAAVEIPESVTKIEGKAFFNTAMESITLSENVKTLEQFSVGYEEVTYENGEYEILPVKGFTIYGYLDTKAESYANTNGFSFRNLGEEGAPNTLVIVHEKSEDTYVIGSGKDLTIYCTGDFDKFVSVEMDGVLVDPSNYTVEEGSTVITFSAAYLDTLSPGKHEVTINYVDDSVSTSITIVGENGEGASTSGNAGITISGTGVAAKTGDSANIAMWLTVAVAAAGIAVVTMSKKRKNM